MGGAQAPPAWPVVGRERAGVDQRAPMAHAMGPFGPRFAERNGSSVPLSVLRTMVES